jgi:hypothetical protein
METIGTQKLESERRAKQRVPYAIDVTLQEMSDISGATVKGDPIIARAVNVSQTGMCVSSRVPLMLTTSLRCLIGLNDLQVAVPTMAQVRWVEKINSRTYLSGLQYLL